MMRHVTSLFFQETHANIIKQYEVVIHINYDGGRRMCICDHEKDAEDIVAALKFAHKEGVV